MIMCYFNQQLPIFKITGARPPQLKCLGGLCPPCPRGSYSPADIHYVDYNNNVVSSIQASLQQIP